MAGNRYDFDSFSRPSGTSLPDRARVPLYLDASPQYEPAWTTPGPAYPRSQGSFNPFPGQQAGPTQIPRAPVGRNGPDWPFAPTTPGVGGAGVRGQRQAPPDWRALLNNYLRGQAMLHTPNPTYRDHRGWDLEFWDDPVPPAAYRPRDPSTNELDFTVAAQHLFDQGASRAELDAFARRHNLPAWGRDLDQAIRFRDRGGVGARFVPPYHPPARQLPRGNPDDRVEALVAGGRALTRAATAGLDHPANAAFRTYAPVALGGDPEGHSFQENLWLESANDAANEEAHPVANATGEILGTLLGPEKEGAVASDARAAATEVLRSGGSRFEAIAAAREAAANRATVNAMIHGGVEGVSTHLGDEPAIAISDGLGVALQHGLRERVRIGYGPLRAPRVSQAGPVPQESQEEAGDGLPSPAREAAPALDWRRLTLPLPGRPEGWDGPSVPAGPDGAPAGVPSIAAIPPLLPLFTAPLAAAPAQSPSPQIRPPTARRRR